jgi:transcriptional antiterminator NusG
MIVNDHSWYIVRNTPRVTGFVGSGVYPVPIDKKEIDELKVDNAMSDLIKIDINRILKLMRIICDNCTIASNKFPEIAN